MRSPQSGFGLLAGNHLLLKLYGMGFRLLSRALEREMHLNASDDLCGTIRFGQVIHAASRKDRATIHIRIDTSSRLPGLAGAYKRQSPPHPESRWMAQTQQCFPG